MTTQRKPAQQTVELQLAPGQPPVRQAMATLLAEVAKVMVGKKDVLELVATAMLTEGAHILFEDLPGLGKSVMAATFAKASGLGFKRVQFTPDLLPSDITGNYVLNQGKGAFDFHEGPIFTNFLLADEINRASPKTQSALLEAMGEKQVSIDGKTHRLPKPFLVMATQNPIEQEGTYPLPEAQMDRFMIKTSVGHPDVDEEHEILHRRNARHRDDFDVKPACTAEQLVQLQQAVEKVFIDQSLLRYIATIITATRQHPAALAGASPRGSLALLKLSKSAAALHGRAFVVPDDIRKLVPPVLGHRVLLRPEAQLKGTRTEQILADIMNKIPVPKT